MKSNSRAIRHGLAGVLALLLCATGALASPDDNRPPTIADAHEYLGGMFQRYAVGYVLWYGPGTLDHYRGRATFYGGRDCYSELGSEPSNRVFAVDWSIVSAVQPSGGESVYVVGQLPRPAQYAGYRHYTNFHLNLPDAKVARGVTNALEFLRASCQRRTKFD